jgi:hypothetical protein
VKITIPTFNGRSIHDISVKKTTHERTEIIKTHYYELDYIDFMPYLWRLYNYLGIFKKRYAFVKKSELVRHVRYYSGSDMNRVLDRLECDYFIIGKKLKESKQ